MIADAVSFVVSALLVGPIRAPEPAPERPADQAGVLAGITEGLRFVFGHPRLRLLVIAVGIGNLAWAVQMSLFILFASRTVGVPPAMIPLARPAARPWPRPCWPGPSSCRRSPSRCPPSSTS